MRLFTLTSPINSMFLRVFLVVLAPLQWGAIIWYMRRLALYPKTMLRRLGPWIFMVAVCVVGPITIYLLNARMTPPDKVTTIVGALEELVFLVLLLFGLRNLSKSNNTGTPKAR